MSTLIISGTVILNKDVFSEEYLDKDDPNAWKSFYRLIQLDEPESDGTLKGDHIHHLQFMEHPVGGVGNCYYVFKFHDDFRGLCP